MEGVTVSLSPDKPSYSGGEGVVVTASIRNDGERELRLAPLSAASMEFWWEAGGSGTPLRRKPVTSAKEPSQLPLVLAPGATIDRRFLFCDVTLIQGQCELTAIYRSSVAEKLQESAEAARFAVTSDTMFERTSDGLISRGDALDLARNECGGNPGDMKARLIRNEAGFLDWWVGGYCDDVSEEKAWLINAHTGVVRSEASTPPSAD